MDLLKKNLYLLILLFAITVSVTISACNDNNITEPAAQTDDEYLQTTAINTAFSSDADDDDNLMASEVMDFDASGPVSNSPYDSLFRWGRRVSNVNVNANITNHGDTIKNVLVTRTITGNFVVIGYMNGSLDSTVKPYSQEQKRMLVFKRVAREPQPRRNWRLFKYTAIDGETKTPQMGKSNIIMSKVELYRNNNLVLTLNGPDFTVNIFNARFFGGNSQCEVSPGDHIRVKVYLTSNQSDTDIVAYHWARNSFGFHRESFVMTSQVPNGSNFDRTYEKTFPIFPNHGMGMHNAYISANTRGSLYDNSPDLFSSTYMGLPYRVRH